MGIEKAQGAPIRQNANLFGSPKVEKAAPKTAQPIQIVKTKELGRDFLNTPVSAYAGLVQISQPTGVQTAGNCYAKVSEVPDFAAFQGNFRLQNPQQALADLESLSKTIGYMMEADETRIAEHMQAFNLS